MNTHPRNQGYIKRNPDGYAFFISKNSDQQDVFIPAEDINGAMSNDVVEIKIFHRRSGSKSKGVVVKILERHFKTVVGRIERSGSHYIVKDTSSSWGQDLRIAGNHVSEAQSGQLVLAEILSYPETPQGFCGRVVSCLGDPSDPITDVKRVAAESRLPMEFQPQALKEVSRYKTKIPISEIQKRLDLRDLPFVTIDGQTAQDFDDAIYVESKGDHFRLVVAIADVSFYVQPGMAVDEDALERGTSTYFPNYVIPMLPEGLSNELCSLKPHEDRLAMVADMIINSQGELLSSKFYEAVIQSHGRLTYGQVQQILEGASIEELNSHKEGLFLAQNLAQILMRKRFDEGSLDLDIPEILVEVDDQGYPVDIQISERIFAHRLIEEFMLKANVAVSEFIFKRKNPQPYRVHEEPDLLPLDTFMRFFNRFTQFKFTNPDPRQICEELSKLPGKEKNILQTLFLRSMNQAKYSPQSLGHFGLAFNHYTHFTSPIRRYPDLITHRILKHIIGGTGGVFYSEEDLSDICKRLSEFEQRSVKSERKVKSIKKARFAQKLLGEEFTGRIGSVAKFGVFITLDQYPLEGMVRVNDLGHDRYIFNEDLVCLVGLRSGKQFNLGDCVKVKIARVSVEDGLIDFVLEEHEGQQQKNHGSPKFQRRGFQKRSGGFKKGSKPLGEEKRETPTKGSQEGPRKEQRNPKRKSKKGKNFSSQNQGKRSRHKKKKSSNLDVSELFTCSHRKVKKK